MRKYTLKPSALYIICGAILVLAAALTLLVWQFLSSFKILMYALIGLFWGLAVLFGFILLPMYFRRTVIYISSNEITLHTGLIFLRREQVKMSAVQYVTRVSLPLGGVTGFNFIVARALGGSVVMPFLNVTDCDEILDVLHLEIQKRQ